VMCLSEPGRSVIVLKRPLMVGFGENAWCRLEQISVCEVAVGMWEVHFREMKGWRWQKGGVIGTKGGARKSLLDHLGGRW
jgi:hypothetical protein